MEGSHAVPESVARGGNVTSWADVTVAMEFVVTHLMAMETCSPVSHMGIKERFVVLGQGEVQGVRGMRVVRDVESGRKSRALISKVIEEGVDLCYSGFQAKLSACTEQGTMETDIAALEESIGGSVWGINACAKLDVRKGGMGNWRRHC